MNKKPDRAARVTEKILKDYTSGSQVIRPVLTKHLRAEQRAVIRLVKAQRIILKDAWPSQHVNDHNEVIDGVLAALERRWK